MRDQPGSKSTNNPGPGGHRRVVVVVVVVDNVGGAVVGVGSCGGSFTKNLFWSGMKLKIALFS